VDWIFWASSEKGRSRKHTRNWVTRWRNSFWGNLTILRCFTKRIFLGEIEFGIFLGFTRGSTWGCEEGGPTVCFLEEFN
jgi:hypothetical protein